MLAKLKKRADFLALQNGGSYVRSKSVAVQACCVEAPDFIAADMEAVPFLVFVGFTTSRKVGNAVQRNRARRRLRAWAGQNLSGLICDTDLSQVNTRPIPLSKTTWRAFCMQQKRTAKALGPKTRVLAFVFIANKLTPKALWAELDKELRETVRRSLRTPPRPMNASSSHQKRR